MKIGIITAMSSEFGQIAKMLESPKSETIKGFPYMYGRIRGNEIILSQCGIGKVNAATGCISMINNFQPDCVISTGCAGGIDKSIGVMDVVVGTEMVYHDVWCGEGNEYGQVQGMPPVFLSDKRLVNILKSITTNLNLHFGLICGGDRFITEKSELQAIKERFPKGLAVDMESTALAQVCHICNIPFLSLRVISDSPGAENHAQQYENFWAEMADRSFGSTKNLIENLPENL